jgi:predicted DNA binding protein
VLKKEENRVKFNTIIENPYLIYMIIQCGVLIDYPVKIRDGFAEWRLISTKRRIASLLDLLEKKGVNFLLLQILKFPNSIHDDEEKFNLEESQVLDKAIRLGFFEIPRKISLAELANKLGRSKSTLSVMLRKIIRKKVLFES